MKLDGQLHPGGVVAADQQAIARAERVGDLAGHRRPDRDPAFVGALAVLRPAHVRAGLLHLHLVVALGVLVAGERVPWPTLPVLWNTNRTVSPAWTEPSATGRQYDDRERKEGAASIFAAGRSTSNRLLCLRR
jgi:hypothetical protein